MASRRAQLIGQPSLARSWSIQQRVIRALLFREMLTRYGRHNIGFLWLFVEPMLFTLGVTALWTATQSVHGSDLPIVAFALTGYSSVLLWRNMPTRCIGAITPSLALLYHRNVRPIDIYLSRLLLEAAGATMSFVFLALFFIFIGWLNTPEDALQVIGGWIMLAWFGAGLALFLGALSESSEIVEKLWHPMAYLTFPLSGAAFLVDALPQAAQEYVLILPMIHGVEYLREGYFGSQITAHYDLGYMAGINTVLTLLGLAQVAKVSRTVVPE
ncbi:MAG TPA: ABC transporter permease [Sphingomicrobium sp.]|nr:ABC transporter permease [Sphingomicrobium sp.]